MKKIIAIIRNEALEKVEGRLVDMRVKGISVTSVKGYGEFANFINPDWMVTHSKLEIFAEQTRIEEIAAAIMDAAHTGMEGDGMLAVIPVEKLYRIRTKSEITRE